jgi:hypothetical protein
MDDSQNLPGAIAPWILGTVAVRTLGDQREWLASVPIGDLKGIP